MTQSILGIAVAGPHDEKSECPFCPPPKDETFSSVLGSKALSTTLGFIMEEPEKLGKSIEATARPKDGKEHRQSKVDEKLAPTPPLMHDEFGPYSYEAHHCIPGKQSFRLSGSKKSVLSGHAMEGWVKKGKLIKKDTGYSINNSTNGVWLPSIPEQSKKLRGRTPSRPWASAAKAKGDDSCITENEKYEIAKAAMKANFIVANIILLIKTGFINHIQRLCMNC